MKPKQRMLVQLSFTKLSAHTDEVAERFYQRLFELAPESREMFEGFDMKAQGRKFVQTLGLTVRHLDRPEEIPTALARLGWQHIRPGVLERHSQVMEGALLATLEESLEDDFGPDERLAWAETFRLAVAALRQVAETEAEGQAGAGEEGPAARA